MQSKTETPDVWILYTNWKGVTRVRHILPILVWYGKSEWHEGEQWFLDGFDLEREGLLRTFALSGIHKLSNSPIDEGDDSSTS